jgi:DNA modification methylase
MNLLINDDCFESLKTITDNSVNFICIDPPYNMTAAKWDVELNFNLLWKEFDRIGKSNYITAIFCNQPFTTKVISSSNNFRYMWYWLKNQGTNFLHAKNQPIRKVEEIAIFYKNKGTYNPQISDGHIPTNSSKSKNTYTGETYHLNNTRNDPGGKTTRFPTNILDFKCVNNYNRLHSSQKPVELLEYLIKTYTNEDELVLDCFAGSGSTLIAAKNTNRNFIGIEKEAKFCDIIKMRLGEDGDRKTKTI